VERVGTPLCSTAYESLPPAPPMDRGLPRITNPLQKRPDLLRRPSVVLVGLWVLLLTTVGPLHARTLSKLTVAGALTVRPEQIAAWSGLEVDQEISPDRVADAIRALYATGKFRDIFVYEVPGGAGGGEELIVNVTEYPRMSEMRFEGLNKIRRDDLEKEINVQVGDFLSPALVRSALDQMRGKYRAEGYFNAKVDADPSVLQQMGSVPLLITVVEGAKVQVRRIRIEGNIALEDEKLVDVMEQGTDGWLSSGTFKSPIFEADLERIVERYQQDGYLDAVVSGHEILELPDDENHLELVITVDEGIQYFMGTLAFEGNTVFEDERVEQMILLHEGDVFSSAAFQETMSNLRQLYWEKGYIYFVADSRRNFRMGNFVDIELSFKEGDQARVRRVEIVGNTKTHEKVIRREMRILPGDLFVHSDLRDSQGDIFRLGFFSDVQVDFNPVDETDQIDLVFDVEEKQTGQFSMGVGFSQQTQASGFLNVGENNLFGKGQSLQFSWQFGSRRQFLDLSFTEPWAFGTPTLLGVDVFNRFSNRIDDVYDTRTKGFALRVGRPIPGTRFTRGSFRFGLTQTTLDDFDPFYAQTLDALERELGAGGVEFQRLDKTDWPQTEIGVTTTIVRNSSDNPFLPTRGSKARLRHEINGGIFGGDLDYQQLSVEYDWYHRLPLNLTFHVGTASGHLLSYGGGPDVPDYERFRLGGNRFFKLRGYRDLEVVPRGNPSFQGGRFYTTISSEIAYPVSHAFHILAFVDQGDVWNAFEEADLTNLRTGAGFGVRLEVPLVGRIGFDFGYGFDKDGLFTDPGWESHFNFGTLF
jgi:outer membrane protein insertion porin family